MYLFGASGHGKVIVDVLLSNNIKVSGFYDEDESKTELWGIPVLGKTKDFKDKSSSCIVAIGDNATRKKVADFIDGKFGQAVHKSCILSSHVQIEDGTVVMAGTVINADTQIGKHVIINTSASIDHDCVIDDFVHIAPNSSICGGVKVGEGTLIGAGATVIPMINIGKWCVIGAGSVITKDIPDYSVVVGNPGRIINQTNND